MKNKTKKSTIDNQKFLRLLSTLNYQEVKLFQNYLAVSNPQIRYQKKCAILLGEIIKKADKKKDDHGQDYLFFPAGLLKHIAEQQFAQPINAKGTMNFYLSCLYKTLENYIGCTFNGTFSRDIINPDYLKKLLFLEFLQKKDLPNLFNHHYKKIKASFTDAKKSEHLYYFLKTVEQLNINQQIFYKTKKHHLDYSNLYILTARYNFLTLLKLACSQTNTNLGRSVIEKKEKEKKQLSYFINFQDEIKKFEDDQLLQLYYSVHLALTKETSINYIQKLIKSISKHQNIIASLEIQKLYKYIENICLEQTRKGSDPKYRLLLINIYQYLDELDLLVPMKTISIRLFLNTVNESAKTQNFDWGHQFIKKYSPRLPIKERTKITNIGKGLLFFENAQFQESIDILDQYDMYIKNDLKLENNRTILLIKAFYETNQIDYLEPRIKMHLNYLRKTKHLSSAFTQPSRLFLQHLNKLIKINSTLKLKGSHNGKIKEKITVLKEKINNSSRRIDNKVWLLKKLNIVLENL